MVVVEGGFVWRIAGTVESEGAGGGLGGEGESAEGGEEGEGWSAHSFVMA